MLDGLDLVVPVGARLLIVSQPDAAGSMLLRILAGLSHADGGQLLLAGTQRADESAQGWARRIGYVGPRASIHPWLSPGEALDLAARLAGLDRAQRPARVAEAAERYGLSGVLQRPIRRGGAGVGQRVAIATAMINDPEIVLLDEPLRALDPEERFRLLKIPGERRTVLLASRYPGSEAGLIDRIALLRDGRVALHAPARRLDERGLPLSLRGIEALAEPQLTPPEVMPPGRPGIDESAPSALRTG